MLGRLLSSVSLAEMVDSTALAWCSALRRPSVAEADGGSRWRWRVGPTTLPAVPLGSSSSTSGRCLGIIWAAASLLGDQPMSGSVVVGAPETGFTAWAQHQLCGRP